MSTVLVILNFNNAADTLNCLRSVEQFNTAPVKYVVVDNGSKDTDLQALVSGMSEIFGDNLYMASPDSGELPYATLLPLPKNVGYACGNNAGLELAYSDPTAQEVMILNNDILFVEDIVPQLLRKLYETPNCGIISPVLYKKGMAELDLNCARLNESVGQITKRNFLHYYWRARGMQQWDAQRSRYLLRSASCPEHGMIEVELPSGSCMLARKEIMQKIGGFDPNTFLYYEENILYKKLQKIGMKVYVDLDCRCIHLGAATTSAMPSSVWLLQCAHQSSKYYVKEYSGASAPKRLLHRLSCAFALAAFRLQKALK